MCACHGCASYCAESTCFQCARTACENHSDKCAHITTGLFSLMVLLSSLSSRLSFRALFSLTPKFQLLRNIQNQFLVVGFVLHHLGQQDLCDLETTVLSTPHTSQGFLASDPEGQKCCSPQHIIVMLFINYQLLVNVLKI